MNESELAALTKRVIISMHALNLAISQLVEKMEEANEQFRQHNENFDKRKRQGL